MIDPGDERVLYVALGAVVAALLFWIWATGAIAGALFGSGWAPIPAGATVGVALRLPFHLGDPRLAWPPPARGEMPGAGGIYATAALLLALLGGLAALAARRLRGVKLPWLWRRREKPPAARWAGQGDLEALRVSGPEPRRLILGRSGGELIAAEPGQSVIVFGPTQTHKTSGLVIPALLEWEGPVLCTSVKSDVLSETLKRRDDLGDVWVFDPAQVTDMERAQASPLSDAGTWGGALRVAHWLAGSAKDSAADLRDGDFWFATAEKLIAPLLFVAARSEGRMAEVVAWLDEGPEACEAEMRERLENMGAVWEKKPEGEEAGQETQAQADSVQQDTLEESAQKARREAKAEAEAVRRAYMATQNREERQRSSVYTTAETILAAFADPGVAQETGGSDYTPEQLLGGKNTLYLISPSREQERLRTVFSTLVEQLLHLVEARAAQRGAPIDPPLLLLLDECANIAPFPGLDETASTAAGLGVQLVTVFQDLSQMHARFGRRTETIVNNHRATVAGNGISDVATLRMVSQLVGAGEFEQRSVSTSRGERGRRSETEGEVHRELAPGHLVRQQETASGILIYGSLPPATIQLRPWFDDPELQKMCTGRAPTRPT